MDKSVDTGPDFQGEGEWRMVQLEYLLAALVDSKVVSMKADQRPNYLKKPLRLKDHKHKHCRHGDRSRHKQSVCKVRQWDDGTTMLVCDKTSNASSEEKYVTVDMDELREERRKRKKKRRQQQHIVPIQPILPVTKVVESEDLPRRAKWTIIFTAGFLLLTCFLLVGVTLRMAPIIDQMVHNQNEELMNSLKRQEFNESTMNQFMS